jgi:hypothetical protein
MDTRMTSFANTHFEGSLVSRNVALVFLLDTLLTCIPGRIRGQQ